MKSPELFFQKMMFGTALVMAASFPVSFALFNVGAVALMILFVLRKIYQKKEFVFDPLLDGSLVLFFLVTVLSSVFSTDLPMSLQGLHKLFRYLFLFVACREILSEKKQLWYLAFALIAGGALTALDGLLQGFLGADPMRGRNVFLSFQNLIRITASFPNPNALANYLAMIVPFGFALWQGGELKPKSADLLLALLVPAVAALGLTYSRPAALALVLNVLFFILFGRKKGILVILLGGLFMLFLLLQGGVSDWIGKLQSWQDFFYDPSRNYHHQAAIRMIFEKPWLGVGLNTFDVNYFHFRVPGDPFTRWSAHQSYLQLAGEIGLTGLFAFLLVITALIYFCIRDFRSLQDPFLRASRLGFLGGVLAFLVIGFFESNFWQPRQAYFFWFWSGLMCNAVKLITRVEETSDEN